ncbi:DUF4232 domain-containing protein [Actinoplanes sp. NPDC051470]|uniref:DUF4232 domain-containing protein n=1 Tax=Actinoplanes sp. NPDC051470 TaxID=3157224 RepID=UPI00343BE258
MTTRHIRLMMIGAFGLGLALTQQACAGIGPDLVAGPAPSATSETVDESTAPADSPTTQVYASPPEGQAYDDDAGPADLAPDDGGKGRARNCANDGLQVTVTLQPDRGDRAARGLVAVTNTGKRACSVEGRVMIWLTNVAGEVVKVPATQVNEPGAGTAISLRPGRSAFQGIKWAPCDKGNESCPTGNGLGFSVNGSTGGPGAELSGFPRPESSGITMKSLRIGTLQPVTQGVVAW